MCGLYSMHRGMRFACFCRVGGCRASSRMVLRAFLKAAEIMLRGYPLRCRKTCSSDSLYYYYYWFI